MSYNVTIIDQGTDERVDTLFEGEWDDGHEFLWEQGNFSCDCNRGLFFANASNDPDPDVLCGQVRYSVIITYEGEVVYDESEFYE